MKSVLENEMHQYFTKLNIAEQKSVLEMLKTFLKSRTETPQRISIEQYNAEIEKAMQEVRNGETFSQNEVVEMVKNW